MGLSTTLKGAIMMMAQYFLGVQTTQEPSLIEIITPRKNALGYPRCDEFLTRVNGVTSTSKRHNTYGMLWNFIKEHFQ